MLTFWTRCYQAPKGKSGKKVAAAPLGGAAGKNAASKKNPLFERRPKSFAIGASLSAVL